MSEAVVRLCEPRDIPAIVALELASEGVPQWGDVFWQEVLSRDALLRGVIVAEVDGQVRGYAVTSCVAGIAELESLAVSEGARRRGLGRALCERVFLWAREYGANCIELEVRESNVVALNLYRRLGFLQQGQRPMYYRNPEENALLLAIKL